MKLKRAIFVAAILTCAGSTAWGAECFVSYKASKTFPLDLHYGVAQLSEGACADLRVAEEELENLLDDGGWNLSKIYKLLDRSGAEERRSNAGEFYLRFQSQ